MATLETKTVGDIVEGNITYYVPSYQRGYRWGKNEVGQLLNDVKEAWKKNKEWEDAAATQTPESQDIEKAKKENTYYLQPIVVSKQENNKYELIDGQQRLTTIYLIYKYMNKIAPDIIEAPKFSLDYETRVGTKGFLEELSLANLESKENDEYIDFHFITEAYKKINEWFNDNPDAIPCGFNDYFGNNVKVIWYESECKSGEELFIHLNSGKIPLTNAELVKAMFLCSKSLEKCDITPEEIALQWDIIEKELHDDSFWYFLTNDFKDKYQTRIDLILDLSILDLSSGKGGPDENSTEAHDEYRTFFKFDELYKGNENLSVIWNNIYLTFLKLKSWYEDHDLYHMIGYLIAAKFDTMNIAKIYKLENEESCKTKSDFKEKLQEEIRKTVNADLSEVNYDHKRDCAERMLLLFNVMSVKKLDNGRQRFPFDKHKYSGTDKVKWSLEHIHAQNSESLRNNEDKKTWLEDHKKILEENREDIKSRRKEAVDETIDKLEKAISDEKYDDFDGIRRDVFELLSDDNGRYVDNISNLALLDGSSNSALNNSVFAVKRKKIIKWDTEGKYIPFCTKMVFLKYYTKEKNQLIFWGEADRNDYYKEIEKVLENYLEINKEA